MKIISKSVNDTIRIGRKIARNLKPADIICLFGKLGSGKTVLTKGIASGLGIKPNKVISPSFILIRQHLQGRLPLYHLDLYRLHGPKDILSLGYQDYLYGDGVTVIEWADRLSNLAPKEFLKIQLSVKGDTQRLLEFQAQGLGYKALLKNVSGDLRSA